MSSFDESKHRRATTGRFAVKRNSAPVAELTHEDHERQYLRTATRPAAAVDAIREIDRDLDLITAPDWAFARSVIAEHRYTPAQLAEAVAELDARAIQTRDQFDETCVRFARLVLCDARITQMRERAGIAPVTPARLEAFEDRLFAEAERVRKRLTPVEMLRQRFLLETTRETRERREAAAVRRLQDRFVPKSAKGMPDDRAWRLDNFRLIAARRLSIATEIVRDSDPASIRRKARRS